MVDLEFRKNFYAKLSKSIYLPADYNMLKSKAESLFRLYKKIQQFPDELPILEIFDFKNQCWTARLLLGIGCELILKAAYIKNGYIINKPKNLDSSVPDVFKDKKIPFKFEDITKELLVYNNFDIDINKYVELKKSLTQYLSNDIFDFNFLIEHLPLLLHDIITKEELSDVMAGLHIARFWRNVYSHTVCDPADFFTDENIKVYIALQCIYKQVFDEEFKIYLPSETIY